MLPPAKKRKLRDAAAQGPNRKRSKQQKQRPKAQGLAAATKRTPRSTATRVAVDAGSLAWKPVDEDEFGDLQFIQGVDVLRDDGKVQFLVNKDDDDGVIISSKARRASDDEGEPFEGFGDDAVESGHLGVGQDCRPEGRVEGGQAQEEAEAVTVDSKVRRPKHEGHNEKKKGKKKKRSNGVDENDEIDIQDKRRARSGVAVAMATNEAPQPAARQPAGANSFSALEKLVDAEDDEEGATDVAPWVPLGLSTRMLSAVARLGFSTPTAIQEVAIREIMAGEDVIGKAQTGSGKTLAFGIPIVERWLEEEDEREEEREVAGRSTVGAEGSGRRPLALVLSPTRELAKQLGDHLRALCEGLPSAPYVCVVTGGLSVHKQQRQLQRADIVVGTPGRLWDVLEGDMRLQETFTHINFLVVDEADRLFTAGQFKEAQDILDALDRRDPEASASGSEEDDYHGRVPAGDKKHTQHQQKQEQHKRQTLVFSATFDRDLQAKLFGSSSKRRPAEASDETKMSYLMKSLKFRRRPKFVDVNPVSRMADGLKEGLIECGAMDKVSRVDILSLAVQCYAAQDIPQRSRIPPPPFFFTFIIPFPHSLFVRHNMLMLTVIVRQDLYLYSVLLLNPNRRSLVFTNSISAVRRLTPLLQNIDLPALPLHSQMAQKARLRSLERFAASSGAILVATDVAARGLDIKDVEQVLHYHVPRTADAYIHRSGRTARGDRSGASIILCSPDEVLPTRRLAGKVHAERGRREHVIQTLSIDHKIAARLKPRVELAKRLADTVLAKEKAHGDETWLRNAASDLGVDYDSDELAAAERGGRGGGRRRKEKEAKQLSKAEMRSLRAKLRDELSRRVNLGVSEKYITGGRVDVAQLLREREQKTVGGIFLGGDGLGLDL